MIPSVLGLVALLGVAGFFIWERHDTCKALIEGDLRRFHFKDITISPDWFDFDRDTFTYDVEYTDDTGRRVLNRCKVNVHLLGDQMVYWQHPIRPGRG